MAKILKVLILVGPLLFIQGILAQDDPPAEVKEEVVEKEEPAEVKEEVVEKATEEAPPETPAESTPEGEVKREIAEVKEYTAVDILKNADEVRNPSESFFMKVKVTNLGDEDNPSIFDVSIKGNNKTLIKTLLPKRDRGRNLLMLEENMWVYSKPQKISKSVSFSKINRSSGQWRYKPNEVEWRLQSYNFEGDRKIVASPSSGE